MINVKTLLTEMEKQASHVDKQRREDWLTEAIHVETYNADMTKSFETSDQRNSFIEDQVTKDIRRLGSFGGNDIAAFWLDHNDIFSPFTNDEGLPQNTQSVIESKLCIIAPSRMTGDMIRGVALEPMAKLDFERRMASKGFTPRPDMLNIFTSLYDNRIPEHPWLVGMPDGIYEDDKGNFYVVDFKVPANPDTVKLMQRDPPDGYNAQMGTYEAILGFHGISVKDRILAPLSLKTMETTSIIMPKVKGFTKTLLNLGDNAWNHVLSGTIPIREYAMGDLNKVEAVNKRVELSANKFVYLNAIKNLAEKGAKKAREELEYDLMKYHGIDPSSNKKVKLPVGISYSTTDEKPELNKDALIRKVLELGGDIEHPDLYVMKNSSTRITVSTSKKDVYAPYLDQIKSTAGDIMEDAIEELAIIIGHEENYEEEEELSIDRSSEDSKKDVNDDINISEELSP